MQPKDQPKPSFFKVFFDAFKRQIGVHEALFCAGLVAIFCGIWGLWSVFGALTVCGAVLVVVAVFSIVFAKQGGA